MARPLLIAHRGASAEQPENTIAAFQRALELQVDGIELDVQTTREREPVVFHDFSLRRLTGQPGRLAGKTWADLQGLRIMGTESIPRLADVLALVNGRITVQVELKKGVAVGPVVRAIQQARAAAWVILSSFEAKLVRQAAELGPTVRRLLISEGRGGSAHLLRQMAAAKADGLSLNFRTVRSRAFVERIQRSGAVLWCWTVNDPKIARRLAGWGVDGLVGDNPDLLKRTV